MNALTESWIEVGALADIPAQGARVVKTATGCIALFRTADDQVFALNDRCPHKGGPLSQGIVFGESVACPLHNWSIDLASGEPMGADKGKGCAPVVPLLVRDGRIVIEPWDETMVQPASVDLRLGPGMAVDVEKVRATLRSILAKAPK